jgi:hypothetical protein
MDDDSARNPSALSQDLGSAQTAVAPDGDETHRALHGGLVPALGAVRGRDLGEVVRAVGLFRVRHDDAIDLVLPRVRPRVVKTLADALDLDVDMVTGVLEGIEVLPGVVIDGEVPRFLRPLRVRTCVRRLRHRCPRGR